jgi:ribonuclease Z
LKESLSAANAILSDIGIQRLENIQVIHCGQSYGLVLEGSGYPNLHEEVGEEALGRSTFKLVYSGDTRPSDRLVEMGRDATILIHEATFEDSLQDEAVAKKHCTVGEALGVAARMNCFRVILTHFSQRYTGIPSLDGLRSDAALAPLEGMLNKCVFAFDFMSLSFPSLLWAPLYLKPLVLAFPPQKDKESDVGEAEDGVPRPGSESGCLCAEEVCPPVNSFSKSAGKRPKNEKLCSKS